MSVKLIEIAGSFHTFLLSDGTTLRLDAYQEKTIDVSLVSSEINSAIAKGLIVLNFIA